MFVGLGPVSEGGNGGGRGRAKRVRGEDDFIELSLVDFQVAGGRERRLVREQPLGLNEVVAASDMNGFGEGAAEAVAAESLGIESSCPRGQLQKMVRLPAPNGLVFSALGLENKSIRGRVDLQARKKIGDGSAGARVQRNAPRPDVGGTSAAAIFQIAARDRDVAGNLTVGRDELADAQTQEFGAAIARRASQKDKQAEAVVAFSEQVLFEAMKLAWLEGATSHAPRWLKGTPLGGKNASPNSVVLHA